MKLLSTIAVLALFCLLIAVPVQAKKSGEIKNDVYTDSDFGFSIMIPEGWSAKVGNAKVPLKLTLTQKSYPVPQEFQGGSKRDYAQIPIMSVLADTTAMDPHGYIEYLRSGDRDDPRIKYFLRYLDIIGGIHDVETHQKLTINDHPASLLNAKEAYVKQVAELGSDVVDEVNDYHGGSVFAIKNGNTIVVLHLICERDFHKPNLEVLQAMVNSMKFE